jgi:dihydroxy-acid dehydratase
MTYDAKPGKGTKLKLRSQIWFDNPDDPDMTALYIERYMNWGITREELQSGKPIIGIAQSGSDLSPCNRQHIVLAAAGPRGHPRGRRHRFRVSRSIRSRRRASALPPALDRNLAYLGWSEPCSAIRSTAWC